MNTPPVSKLAVKTAKFPLHVIPKSEGKLTESVTVSCNSNSDAKQPFQPLNQHYHQQWLHVLASLPLLEYTHFKMQSKGGVLPA